MNNMYSPNWNKIIWPIHTTFSQDFYYCPAEKKCYQMKLQEIKNENVWEPTLKNMIKIWQSKEIKENLSIKDLERLWLM